MIKDQRNFKFETLALHAGQEYPDSATDARCVPIYQTSSYVFANTEQAKRRFDLAEAGNIYSRITNPTTDIFEKRIAALEGGIAALATASGAAAITYAVINIASAGDHIVSSSTIYGGTYNLFANTLKDYGISTTFVDPDEKDSFKNAIKENTKLIFIESLGNPNCNIIDIEKVADIAHSFGIPLIVDNTFATPYLLRPLQYGADIVVHSATKFIGGHGTSIGGVIVDGGSFNWAQNDKFESLSKPNASYHNLVLTDFAGPAAYIAKARVILLRDIGAAMSPFNAFLFLQGLETLPVRIDRHIENTKKVIKYLNNHPKTEKVNHPSLPDSPYKMLYDKYFPYGAGSIFTFEIKGGEENALKFIDNLQLFSLLANVADLKSLVIHPASTTHSQLSEEEKIKSGIKQNTIRLSIGTEHIDDIIYDLENAFKCI